MSDILFVLKFLVFKLNIPAKNHDYHPIRSIMNTQTLLLSCELSDINFIIRKSIIDHINTPSFLNYILFKFPSYNSRIVPFLYAVLQHKLPY